MKLTILELINLIEEDNSPFYILIAGSVGSGKSYLVNQYLSHIQLIDPDTFTMQLGDGVYESKNVAKSMSMVKKTVKKYLDDRISFIQQGTSANLQATINKLIAAKEKGYKTVLFYVDTIPDKAGEYIKMRVSNNGRGSTITKDKIVRTYNGSNFTYRFLTSDADDYFSLEEKERIDKILNKFKLSREELRNNLDYFIRIEN